MKTQSWTLAATLALVFGSAAAQEKKTSAASPQASVAQRAEALTEDQINQSHDIAALTRLAQVYGAQNDNQRLAWVLHRVSELTPNSGDLKMQLALVYAKMGDKSKAYDTLLRMQAQGFGYDISDDKRFEPVHGTRVWDYIVANLQVNSKQFGEGKVAFELPKTDKSCRTARRRGPSPARSRAPPCGSRTSSSPCSGTRVCRSSRTGWFRPASARDPG